MGKKTVLLTISSYRDWDVESVQSSDVVVVYMVVNCCR